MMAMNAFKTTRGSAAAVGRLSQARKHATTNCASALSGSRRWAPAATGSSNNVGGLGGENQLPLFRKKDGERKLALRLYCSGTSQEASAPSEAAPVDERQELLNRLDIRTGKILSVTEHEEADR